jgi:hypothetical protein
MYNFIVNYSNILIWQTQHAVFQKFKGDLIFMQTGKNFRSKLTEFTREMQVSPNGNATYLISIDVWEKNLQNKVRKSKWSQL